MEPPGRRGAGAARGPAELGAPGGGAAAAGPARFQCPEDFCARPFAPDGALGPDTPGKRLLLLSAPADFRPESLSGHRLALPGSPLVRASQPGGGQKLYSLRAGREESAARLLIAGPEGLTCAQPFAASLRIQERPAPPGAPRALFPAAERPPPQVPGGLKQRFFPFGARRPASDGAPAAARKRAKKRPLLPLKEEGLWQPEGPEPPPPGGFPAPLGALLGGGAWSKQWPPREEEEGEEAVTEPALLPALGRDAPVSGHSEEGPLSGEAEGLDGRRARKRGRKRQAGLEAEEVQEPSSRYWQPEGEPWLLGEREPPEGDGCAGEPAGPKAKKKKKKKKEAAREEAVAGGLWAAAAAAAIKEEPVEVPCVGEEDPGATGGDPAGEGLNGQKKKKKKKRRSRERPAEELWAATAIKEEPGDVPCLGSLPEEAPGSPREEPAGGFAGHIKQSPGKGAGGPWGTVALKEELGDLPSLGSRGAIGQLPSCKKKKSRERVAEVLGGFSALKEEPGDTACSGGLLGGGLAGELLACKKEEKGEVDQEPLQLDWAALLWQEAGPKEEPLQANGAAWSPSPKRKKKKRKKEGGRRGEDQAGLCSRNVAALLPPTVAPQQPGFYSRAAGPSE
ncbi:DNA-directed RNA polymerase I subunit RPA34 [Erythrolamprus reginae]|uniref:DNA-directed RNA polymerase I subunit RPA34 n=1 Tax=Erythrolamprus reginae TaxID=121349 RepID=UPI00396C8B09